MAWRAGDGRGRSRSRTSSRLHALDWGRPWARSGDPLFDDQPRRQDRLQRLQAHQLQPVGRPTAETLGPHRQFHPPPHHQPRQAQRSPPPRTPLGALALTGRACPETGWWQCADEGAPVLGGSRQFIRQNEPMPEVVLQGGTQPVAAGRGETPQFRRATVWQLSAYPDDAAATHATRPDTARSNAPQPPPTRADRPLEHRHESSSFAWATRPTTVARWSAAARLTTLSMASRRPARRPVLLPEAGPPATA